MPPARVIQITGGWAMRCCSGHIFCIEYRTENAACEAAKKHNELFRTEHDKAERRFQQRERREQRQLREQQNASASASQANTTKPSWADVVARM